MPSKSMKRPITQGGIVSQLYWRIGILVALNLLVVALAIWEFGLFNRIYPYFRLLLATFRELLVISGVLVPFRRSIRKKILLSPSLVNYY
jgi:hypothetical protein